jgi:hypothetical protein
VSIKKFTNGKLSGMFSVCQDMVARLQFVKYLCTNSNDDDSHIAVLAYSFAYELIQSVVLFCLWPEKGLLVTHVSRTAVSI